MPVIAMLTLPAETADEVSIIDAKLTLVGKLISVVDVRVTLPPLEVPLASKMVFLDVAGPVKVMPPLVVVTLMLPPNDPP